MDKSLKLLPLLAAAVLSACGNATSSFYVTDAGSGDPRHLRQLAEQLNSPQGKTLDYPEIVQAHRIGIGKGAVLAYREASADRREKLEKLTIILPHGIGHPGTTLQFSGGIDRNSPVALLSMLAPAVEINNCTGFASKGALVIMKVEGNKILAEIDAEFDLKPVHRYDTCAPLRLNKSIEFHRKRLADLKPWEGRATGPYIPMEWSPFTATDMVWRLSTFVVEHAEQGAPRWNEALRKRIDEGAVPVIEWKYASAPHRIAPGSGTVFAYRSFGNQKYATDSAFGFDLTLFLRQPLPTRPTTIKLGRDFAGGEAFASDWSSWGGCVAMASRGAISINSISESRVLAHVQLDLDWVPIDWDPVVSSGRKRCPNDKVFSEDLVFQRKAIAELTAEDGRSDESAGEPVEWQSSK